MFSDKSVKCLAENTQIKCSRVLTMLLYTWNINHPVDQPGTNSSSVEPTLQLFRFNKLVPVMGAPGQQTQDVFSSKYSQQPAPGTPVQGSQKNRSFVLTIQEYINGVKIQTSKKRELREDTHKILLFLFPESRYWQKYFETNDKGERKRILNIVIESLPQTQII